MTSSILSWFFWLLLLTEKKNKIEDEFLANSMMIYIFFFDRKHDDLHWKGVQVLILIQLLTISTQKV